MWHFFSPNLARLNFGQCQTYRPIILSFSQIHYYRLTSQKSFLNAKACLNFTVFKFKFRLNGILLNGAGNSKHTNKLTSVSFG